MSVDILTNPFMSNTLDVRKTAVHADTTLACDTYYSRRPLSENNKIPT